MKKILFLAMGLLCLTLASSLEISTEYDTNIFVRGVDSSVDLEIEITNATPGTYNLFTFAGVLIKPSETFEITKTPITKKFTLTPTAGLDVDGYYSFTYTLNHRGVEKFDNKMTINFIDLEDTIEISSDAIDMDSSEISFYVQNKNPITLKNLTAEFSSILFETKETFNLGPNEKRKITVDVEENKLKKTKAGVYIIESVFQTNKGKEKINGNLYLGEKKGITTTEDNAGFLIRSETIAKINSGNTIETIEIKTTRNIISRLFTSFNIEPTLTERSGLSIEYTWVKEKLNPTEAYVIQAKTNYVFPLLFLIVIVLAFFGIKRFFETKIEVKKTVHHVKTKNGEFALKVNLAVRAKKDIENVSIIDKVPAIVKIYKKFGTVKPDKIDAANRRIHWNIGDLNSGEVRMFSYIIYSKVGVVGKFSLPEALSVFEQNGKIHEVDSNKVFFMSDQVRD
jgi:hypothetical protein